MTQTAKTADVMPTSGPWHVQPYGDGDSLVIHYGDQWRICFMATPGSSPNAMDRIKADARLIVSACNSYQRHFSDPITAAESDWIARAVEAMTTVLAGLNVRIDEAVQQGKPVPVFAGIADLHDLLSQVREVWG